MSRPQTKVARGQAHRCWPWKAAASHVRSQRPPPGRAQTRKQTRLQRVAPRPHPPSAAQRRDAGARLVGRSAPHPPHTPPPFARRFGGGCCAWRGPRAPRHGVCGNRVQRFGGGSRRVVRGGPAGRSGTRWGGLLLTPGGKHVTLTGPPPVCTPASRVSCAGGRVGAGRRTCGHMTRGLVPV